jgi:polysaccharide pyruvyl transferase CsaB
VLAALAGCDALVLGGGSLLQDATSFNSLLYYAALIVAARLQGKPVLLWGQGLGPLRRRRSEGLVRMVLPLATGISWRDPDSAALAARWGVHAPIGSDPVWGLPPQPWTGAGGPIILCWRQSPLLDQGRWQALLSALDQLADQSGRLVQWLPFHLDQDRGLLEELDRRGWLPARLKSRSSLVEVGSPEEAQARLAGAGLVIAMRLHGLILAALAGAPCAALSYDPKVRSAAEGIGCPCVDLHEPFVAERLCQSWLGQLDRPTDPAAIQRQRQGTHVHRALLAQGQASPPTAVP